MNEIMFTQVPNIVSLIIDKSTHPASFPHFCPLIQGFTIHSPHIDGHMKLARAQRTVLQQMIQLAEGVEFDTICREWRCKWSLDGDKSSLVACQMALESVAEDLYQVDGVKNVERVVCGDCLDFKVREMLAN